MAATCRPIAHLGWGASLQKSEQEVTRFEVTYLAWKMYLLSMLCFSLLVVFSLYSGSSGLAVIALTVSYLPSLMQIVALIGAYGYLKKIRIGTRSLWFACLVLGAIVEALRLAVVAMPNGTLDPLAALYSLALLFFLSPLFYALLRYCFFSSSVWGSGLNDKVIHS